MRGISRKAVELDTKILGTKYHASDIANTDSICNWCHYNYGVDMQKPGAQQFYNSVVELFASWGIDFIKVDDITGYPEEIMGVIKAIENCDRDIVLSLSPGGKTNPSYIDTYKKANMLRITKDIWDNQISIDRSFESWKKYSQIDDINEKEECFWFDLDMLPFGKLCVWNPVPQNDELGDKDLKEINMSGEGFEREDYFTIDQKYTFITQRALSASPLFMGGELTLTDDFSYELITNKEMIACNQNGIMGQMVFNQLNIEIWHTPKRNSSRQGWIGIFNRENDKTSIKLSQEKLGLDEKKNYIYNDIWNKKQIGNLDQEFTINSNGVLFLKYKRVN